MKTLKLNHELASLVKTGQQTLTWRLFDDKDLAVNDDVELIDKVNPHEPATWKVIGIARINKIVQKRVCDMTQADYQGPEKPSSLGKVVELFRQYYGSEVSSDTPVKIIHFSFTPIEKQYIKVEANKTTLIKEARLYADGGSRGNPGPSASGFAIMNMNEDIVVKKGVYLGITTNNQAEYQALRLGLEEARRLQIPIVHVYMDSLLVINQILGVYKVKNRDLWPIYAAIKELAGTFQKISFSHVPREMNKIADGAVNEALDAALKK